MNFFEKLFKLFIYIYDICMYIYVAAQTPGSKFYLQLFT